MTMSVCAGCGAPCTGTYCPECKPIRKDQRRGRGDRRRDVGTTAWISLSKRARRMQPFCSICGSTRDLQVDHSPRAWARHNAHKPIRLCDVTVLCRTCNNRAGSSKPNSPRYQTWIDQTGGDIQATDPDKTLHTR